MISMNPAAPDSNYIDSALFALLTPSIFSPMLMTFRFPSFGEVLVHGDVGDLRKQQKPATGWSGLVARGLLRNRPTKGTR